MILSENFFNKVIKEIRETYFKEENHATTKNKNYFKTTKIVEDFNNGIITYKNLIKSLHKILEVPKIDILIIINRHIRSKYKK